jgi:RecA-family ATPase
LIDFLEYAEKHQFALFPIPAGKKEPFGIVSSFKHDHDSNPETWKKWRADHPGCNFGVVAFASQIITADIDVSGEGGRDEAWALWCELCSEWGIPVAMPHVTSQSGGWHAFFALPPHVDAIKLRQPDAIKGRINLRCVGYTVAPGSLFEGRPYTLMSDAPPHPAPAALITHCTRREPTKTSSLPGSRDKDDVAALLVWLNERDAFADYSDWVSAGMALRAEYADDGFTPWETICCDDTVTIEGAIRKWSSFASEPDGNSVTLNSLLARAHALGWKGSIRKSSAAMFGDVAARVASPPPPPQPTTEPDNVLRSRRINAASLAGKVPPDREWLIRDLIPAKNVTLLYGDGGTGKSLLALQAAAAVVLGTSFFGRLVTKGSVEFVTAEDTLDEMHRRLNDIARNLSVEMGALDGLHLTSLTEADALLAVPQDNRGGALIGTDLYAELSVLLAENSPAVLFLDTLADIYGGNEVVRAQARQFIGMLRRLALQHGCTVVVLAHPSLAGMEGGTSGSTAWNNSVRSRLYLNRVRENDGSEIDEDLRTLRVQKSNYGRVGDETQLRWRDGVFVSVHQGSGDPLVASARAERVFLSLLTKYADQGQSVGPSPGANYAPKVFESDARPHGVNKRALIAAMQRLLDGKRIWIKTEGPPSRPTRQLVVSTDNSTPSNASSNPSNAPSNGLQTPSHTPPYNPQAFERA